MISSSSIDSQEVEKFSALAEKWWDQSGEFAPLHKLNPLRLEFLREQAIRHFDLPERSIEVLKGLKVADIGCGGGLISEPLARMGAEVTAIDASETNISVAKVHAEEQGLEIDFRATTAEALVEAGETFDLVVSMEVVEHVADVNLFLDCLGRLVGPQGALAMATLNRTPKSFALAIVAAEYLLRWVPRGTHDWRRFLKPSEIAQGLRPQGLTINALCGMGYNPLSDHWHLAADQLDVNYLLFATRD